MAGVDDDRYFDWVTLRKAGGASARQRDSFGQWRREVIDRLYVAREPEELGLVQDGLRLVVVCVWDHH